MTADPAGARVEVALITPMKRGLKVMFMLFPPHIALVALITPMKRGLKACTPEKWTYRVE